MDVAYTLVKTDKYIKIWNLMLNGYIYIDNFILWDEHNEVPR